MTRTTFYAICLWLAFANTAGPAPILAQDSLRSRFFSEGPKGWETLKAAAQHVEGKSMSKLILGAPGVNDARLEETKFKINGEFLVFEQIRKKPNGEIARMRAAGV